MDENTIENIRYEFKLNKLMGDELSYSNSEIQSDPWSDDLDSNFEDKPPEDNVGSNVSYSILYGKGVDEAKLIEENIDLYSDLVKIEEKEKKAKELHEAEFENRKKEIENLREVDARNKTKIEELTQENEKLKLSISSLYRTFKREMERKDTMLGEANSKVARLESLTGSGMYTENGTNYYGYNSSTFRKDNNTYKRKRSESPEASSSKQRDYKSRPHEAESEAIRRKSDKKSEHEISKSKYDLDESEKDKRKSDKKPENDISKDKLDLDSAINTVEEKASKNANHDKETQASNECIFCNTHKNSNAAKTSRDPREINDMFFNLLPDSLKQSFYDYEQDQMVSLNKLKESFIDEYLNSKSDVPSPVLESTPKAKDNRTDKDQLTSNKRHRYRSPSVASTSTSGSQRYRNNESGRRGDRGRHRLPESGVRRDFAQRRVDKIRKNRYNSRLDKKDVANLFKYRNEKMPFTEKRKFGLHKEDKKLIQEKLL